MNSTILTIARREYIAMIGTKAFLLTLVMMPLLMFGGLIAMPLVGRIEGTQQRRIVIADATGQLYDTLAQAAAARNTVAEQANSAGDEADKNPMEGPLEIYQVEPADAADLTMDQKLRYSDQIRDGELYALVEIPQQIMDTSASADDRKIRYVSNSGTLSEVRGWISGVVSQTLRTQRLRDAGIDPELVATAEVPVQVAAVRPYKRQKDGEPAGNEAEEESLATVFAPFLMMMLMFVVIFLAAQPMLESAMEEKTHRISEVLLGCVTPTQMMAGKLLGNVAGSMVIFVVYGVGGFFLLSRFDMLHLLPTKVIFWFLVFQIAGVLLYSSVFMAVGAAVSQLKEAQSLLLPVWLVLAAPMMIWLVALRNPNGMVATLMSFFPPSSPLMMILRLGTGAAVPAWQPPLAAVILVVSVIVVIMLAGRIYRVSLLRSDGASSMLALLKRAV
jgi:ABC-type Na+ efflux pump permease subunit